MKGAIFQHEVSKTSSVFGRKSDVQVVFQGEDAATDGSTIIIPAINAVADVTDEQAAIIRGYVDHESGHVRHSDMGALAEANREARAEGNALRPALINALEDVWLERKVRQEYPGAERNLRATVTAVNREFLGQVEKGDPRLAQDEFITPVALTWEGRKGYGGETCGECLDLLDEGLRKALGKWIAAIDGCESTQDVITLAREVERQLGTGEHREAAEEPGNHGDTRRPEQGDGDGDGEPRSHDDVDEGDGDPQPTRSDPEEHGGDTETGGQRDADTDASADSDQDADASEDGDDPPDEMENPPGGGVGAGTFGTDEPYEADMSRVVEKISQEMGTEGIDVYRPSSTAHDKWHHRLDDERKYGSVRNSRGKYLERGSAQNYSQVLEGTAGVTNVMRRKLERSLMAKQLRDWDTGHEHGRLDSRRLVAAYAGKTNVFKVREERSETDTALSILVDLSGSMSGSCVVLAQQAIIAMVEAIDRTTIAYEVLGWNNMTGWINGIPHPPNSGLGDQPYYDRCEPLDMYVFKDFTERLREVKGALSSMQYMAGGNNSDGEAVQLAYNRLRQRGERRKILMVFSDGYPAVSSDYGNFTRQYRHLRNVIASIEADGVDVMGIGIDSDAVGQFYPKYVVVNNLDDLAGGALDLMARALMGERYQVDNSKLLSAAS